jgi:hypothetical protein
VSYITAFATETTAVLVLTCQVVIPSCFMMSLRSCDDGDDCTPLLLYNKHTGHQRLSRPSVLDIPQVFQAFNSPSSYFLHLLLLRTTIVTTPFPANL